MHRILGLMIALIVAAGSSAFAAQYSLSTAANSGGTVSPQKGKIAVSEGDASDVTFTALPGYYIGKVKVDSVYVPITDRKSFTYRFPDIRKNHKIEAKFLRDPAIHVDYTKGGTIDSGKGRIFVPYSTGRTFAIAPAEGYHIASVTADGTAAGAADTYTFGSVVSRRSLKAKFSLNTYEVELQPGTGGTITPAITTATHGQLKTFTILPDSGMKIGSITVNGAPVADLPEAGPHKVKHTVTGKVSVAATFTERPVEAAFKKAPYLLYTGSNTSMTVLWQATAGLTSTIKWGTDTSYSLGSATVSQSTTDHLFAFPIPDLAPATKYYYKVELSQAAATGSFYTAPAADATKAKLFVFGDTRSNPSRHDKIAQLMNVEYLTDPEYQSIALLTGDLVGSGGSEGDWTNEFFPLKYENIKKFASEIPRMSARGNHEGGAGLFKKYFPAPYVGGRYWSFDYGPAHVVIVDQYEGGGGISTAQLEWITADLAASTKKWKIIMMHEPAWSAGGGHGNSGSAQKKIQPLAKQNGAVVFAGHNHYYSRAVVDGIHHITAGGGGAPLASPEGGRPNIVTTDKSNHFCALDIDGDTMKVRAIRADGTMIEDFTITQP